jgi:hypothetical protein
MSDKSIRIKHDGDIVSLWCTLLRKGWFSHPNEPDKGFRWARIISYYWFAVSIYIVKYWILIAVMGQYMGESPFINF